MSFTSVAEELKQESPSEAISNYQIAFVGDVGSGKSVLIEALRGEQIDQKILHIYMAGVGINFSRQTRDLESGKVTIEMRDFPGALRLRHMNFVSYCGLIQQAQLLVLVFSDKASLEFLDDPCFSAFFASSNIPFIVVFSQRDKQEISNSLNQASINEVMSDLEMKPNYVGTVYTAVTDLTTINQLNSRINSVYHDAKIVRREQELKAQGSPSGLTQSCRFFHNGSDSREHQASSSLAMILLSSLSAGLVGSLVCYLALPHITLAAHLSLTLLGQVTAEITTGFVAAGIALLCLSGSNRQSDVSQAYELTHSAGADRVIQRV